MKLLLDENLSRRLVPALQSRFPGSSQVTLVGLERATDAQLCEYASRHKDDDFYRLVAARGNDPRLIQILSGNVTNDAVLSSLLGRANQIEQAFSDPAVHVVLIQ